MERLVIGGSGNDKVIMRRTLCKAIVQRACLCHRLHDHCQPCVQHVEALAAPRLAHEWLQTSQMDFIFLKYCLREMTEMMDSKRVTNSEIVLKGCAELFTTGKKGLKVCCIATACRSNNHSLVSKFQSPCSRSLPPRHIHNVRFNHSVKKQSHKNEHKKEKDCFSSTKM